MRLRGFLVAPGLLAVSGAALSWWNNDGSSRKPITPDASVIGAD
jgi:hypothetical protein